MNVRVDFKQAPLVFDVPDSQRESFKSSPDRWVANRVYIEMVVRQGLKTSFDWSVVE